MGREGEEESVEREGEKDELCNEMTLSKKTMTSRHDLVPNYYYHLSI